MVGVVVAGELSKDTLVVVVAAGELSKDTLVVVVVAGEPSTDTLSESSDPASASNDVLWTKSASVGLVGMGRLGRLRTGRFGGWYSRPT